MSLLPALLALAFAAESTFTKSADELRVTVPKVTKAPVLDGVLDDSIWRDAITLTDFVQFEPGEGVPASRPSTGYVAYDAEHLYVAFRAHEPDRRRVRATIFPRERGGDGDDRVLLVLDTFLDQRRAFEFEVTPYGIQSDGVKVEGKGGDESVDFVWRSAGQIDDEGWAVELAIPWASLRFPAAEPFDIGFNMIRVFGRSGERAAWAPRRRGSPCDICQQGVLRGFAGVDRGRTVDLLPYVSSAQYGARAYGSDSVFVDGRWWPSEPPRGFDNGGLQARVGGDVRLSLTPSLVLNATVNPDFSQVEADEEQVRVNQRFALFLDERRPFFLEGRDVFELGRDGGGREGSLGDLFYSRAIVDPSAGVRLTGKQRGLTVGALYARDATPAFFYYDGYESGGVTSIAGVGTADVGVVRVRQDVLADSYIGGMLLGRGIGVGRGDASYNVVPAADFSLRRGALTLSGEVARSFDRDPVEPGSSEFRGDERQGLYYRALLERAGRSLSVAVAAAAADEDFRAQLGRFRRIGIERYAAEIEFTQYPNNRLLQRVEESIEISRTNRYGGGLLDYSIDPRLSLEFQRQTSFGGGPHFERVTFAGRALDMVGAFLDFESDAFQVVGVNAFLFFGEREIYDFADPRVGTGIFGEASVVFRPVPRASIQAQFDISNHYDEVPVVASGPDGADTVGTRRRLVDDARIYRLRGSYQFTRALGLRLIGEYSEQFDRLEENPLERDEGRYGVSALLSYELAPMSFLYLGYNDAARDFDEPVVPVARRIRTGRSAFFKLSYLFRL